MLTPATTPDLHLGIFFHFLSLVRPCQGFLLTTAPTRQDVKDACVRKRQCSDVGQRSCLAELSWLPSFGSQSPGAPSVLAILCNKPMQSSHYRHVLFYCTSLYCASQMWHFFSFLNQWNARPSTNEAIKTHFTAMLYCGGRERNLQYLRGWPVRAFSGEAIGVPKVMWRSGI